MEEASAVRYWVILGSLAMGAVCGGVPLMVGAFKNRIGLGLAGFAACLGSGYLLGILQALPVSGVFVWLIIRAGQQRAAAEELDRERREQWQRWREERNGDAGGAESV